MFYRSHPRGLLFAMDKLKECESALYDHSFSVLDRLKVACYLWRESSTPSRQDSLLKLTCDELCTAYNKKTRSPPAIDVCSSLWQFLSVILQSITVQPLENKREWRPDDSVFTTYLFQSMTEALSRESVLIREGSSPCANSVVACLQCVLKGSPLPSVLFKFELVVSLLKSLLKVLISLLMTSSFHSLERDKLFSTLNTLLDYFVYLQGSQGNQKKVFTATSSQLLETVLIARSLLSKEKHGCDSASKEVLKRLDNIFLQLFNRDNLSEFTSAVCSPAELAPSQKRTAVSYTRVLFQTLQGIVNNGHEEAHLAVIEGLPHLLNTLLLQNSRHQSLHRNVEFKFFHRLFHLLDFTDLLPAEHSPMETDGVEQKSSELEKSLSVKFLTEHLEGPTSDCPHSLSSSVSHSLSECLQLLLKYDVYMPGEDKQSGGEQTLLLEGLTLRLLKNVDHQNLDCTLRCLSYIVKLNHKLLEPWLPVVWLFLFTTEQKGELFARLCIETYTKLRQLPLLIGKCLEALDLLHTSPSHLEPRTLLPVSSAFQFSIERLLAKHVTTLPPGQCIEILDLLCQYFIERPTSDLTDKDLSSPKKCRPLPLIPSLERAADIVRVFLSHIPSITWTGRYREKAMMSLLRLHTQVCLPSLNAIRPEGDNERLSSIFLYLTCECCELMTGLTSLTPDLIPDDHLPKLVWQEKHQLLVPESWTEWFSTASKQLDPLKQHLLKRLAIVQLKNDSGDECTNQEKVVDFLFQGFPEMDQCSSPWTGQPLALKPDNCGIGVWNMILSTLPFLYEFASKDNLAAVASGISTALHSTRNQTLLSPENGGVWVSTEIGKFLKSEAFFEMTSLHELLLSGILSLEHKSFPKSFPKQLRKCLLSPETADFFDESFTTSLSAGLQCTLDLLSQENLDRLAPSRKKLDKWLSHLATSFQMLKSLPLRSLGPLSLQRILLVVSVWHSTLLLTSVQSHRESESCSQSVQSHRESESCSQSVQSHRESESCSQSVQSHRESESCSQSVLSLLVSLNYYLSWVLQCLSLSSNFTPSSRKSKSKRESVSAVSHQFSILLDMYLELLYRGNVELHCSQDVKEVPELIVSTLVTMEIVLGARMKVRGYPQKFFEMIVKDMVSDSCSDTSLPERWLCTATTMYCKTYFDTSSSAVADSARPHPPLEHLSGVIISSLERLLQPAVESVLINHPLLVSSLVAVVQCRADLQAPRITRIVGLLTQDLERSDDKHEACVRANENSIRKMNQTLDRFNGMVDFLSLSRLLSERDQVEPSLEAGNKETEALSTSDCSHTVWIRLQDSLKYFLEYSITILSPSHNSSSLVSVLCAKKPKSHPRHSNFIHVDLMERTEAVLTVVCKKISRAMKELVCIADQDQLSAILKSLFHEDLSKATSSCLFCHCWSLILDCKLKQAHREEIRNHLSKVAMSCQSIVMAHKTDIPLVVTSVQLLATVVSIPSPVGLDYQSTLLSLQMCTSLNTYSIGVWKVNLVGAVAELVLAVCRQHSTVATSSPAPIITALIKLVHAVVVSGQHLEDELTGSVAVGRMAGPHFSLILSTLVHSAGVVSRALELVSHQKIFCKFVSYLLYEFVVAVHKQALPSDVKGALLPGVFSLLKLCSPGDIAFIKSSLDPPTRDSCQSLIDEYKQYYKFGGRV